MVFSYLCPVSILAPVKMYTDDTAMTKSVAESLIHARAFDEKDMAKRSDLLLFVIVVQQHVDIICKISSINGNPKPRALQNLLL